jgi:hypothetical protein
MRHVRSYASGQVHKLSVWTAISVVKRRGTDLLSPGFLSTDSNA